MLRRKTAFVFLVFLAAGSALSGFLLCRWPRPDVVELDAATVAWLHSVPDIAWSQWDMIPKERFSAVPPASLAEAIRQLEDVSVVELSDPDLKTFAPALPLQPNGARPYLIRRVFLQGSDGSPMGTGNYSVYHRGTDVLVTFVALGREIPGISKGPLVIWLPFEPDEVFVMCSMVE